MPRHRRCWVSRQRLDRPVVGPVTAHLKAHLWIAQQDSVSRNLPREQFIVRGLDSHRGRTVADTLKVQLSIAWWDSAFISPPHEQSMTRHRRCWVSRQRLDRPVVGPVTALQLLLVYSMAWEWEGLPINNPSHWGSVHQLPNCMSMTVLLFWMVQTWCCLLKWTSFVLVILFTTQRSNGLGNIAPTAGFTCLLVWAEVVKIKLDSAMLQLDAIRN